MFGERLEAGRGDTENTELRLSDKNVMFINDRKASHRLLYCEMMDSQQWIVRNLQTKHFHL
jgi:hypothetical protein